MWLTAFKATRRAVCFTAIMAAVMASPSVAAETWKITSLEWPPYSGKSLKGGGTAISALRELLAGEGIELQVEFYPWRRAQHLARGGDYIGYFPAWPDEVSDGFIASAAITESSLGVMQRRDQPVNWRDIDDLFQRYRVGLVASYVYPPSVTRAADKYTTHAVRASHEKVLLRMLAAGRTDAALTDPHVMAYLATREGIDSVAPHPRLLLSLPLVLAIRNDDRGATHREALNAALAKRLSDSP